MTGRSTAAMQCRLSTPGTCSTSATIRRRAVGNGASFWTRGGPQHGLHRSAAIPRRRCPISTRQGTKGDFLYTSGDRIYARNLNQIIHFQFADASCVAPFLYHGVRSLGWLLYAVCHLQNRLRCKFLDSVFENLLQYFRVANPADMERLTQVNLIDKGFIPDGLDFVKREERWETPSDVTQLAMQMNRQTMADNSVSFTQDWDFGREEQSRETATRTTAKTTATAALVGAMLSQSYKYEEFRYNEDCRRFCIKNSRDPEVRQFRAAMLTDGIPEEALQAERWDITANKIIGSGDKQLQVTIAEALMRVRPFLDSGAQKDVDRLYISAYTEDYALTDSLVPKVKPITKGQELATLAAGTLMAGMQVIVQEGIDHAGYIEAMLGNMAVKVQAIEQQGGMATKEEIMGLANMGQHVQQHIAKLAEDPTSKAEGEGVRGCSGQHHEHGEGLRAAAR